MNGRGLFFLCLLSKCINHGLSFSFWLWELIHPLRSFIRTAPAPPLQGGWEMRFWTALHWFFIILYSHVFKKEEEEGKKCISVEVERERGFDGAFLCAQSRRSLLSSIVLIYSIDCAESSDESSANVLLYPPTHSIARFIMVYTFQLKSSER